MSLFLIRHGETVDNVAAVYAGTTDSALTNHGVLQASRLGTHLSTTGVQVAHIFSSDLQRAVKTAEAIRIAQSPPPPETTKLELLREQDFGFYEGKRTIERPKDASGKSRKEVHADAHWDDPGFKGVESKEQMRSRMETFVDSYLIQLFHDIQSEDAVVVVAHGIILNHLWRAILKQFKPEDVMLSQGVQAADRGFSLEYLGGWSNTGYLELKILSRSRINDEADAVTPQAVDGSLEAIQPPTDLPHKVSHITDTPEIKPTKKLSNMSLVVKAVNSQEHLKGLKKTRGGLGNLKHDSSQKTMDSFFKKRRTE